MTTPKVTGRLTAAVLATLTTLTACQGETPPDSSGTGTPSPSATTPTSPPPDAGTFFTWEQARRLDGAAAAAARTAHADLYFTHLSGRYDAYVDPRWLQITGPKLKDDVKLGYDGPLASRGPVTKRLMNVTITGSTATVETCIDSTAMEYAPEGTDDWSDASIPFAPGFDKLTRSAESPTGWAITTTTSTDDGTVSRGDCRRAFNNAEPAVTKVGEPGYIDSWDTPTPEQTPTQ